MKLCESLNWFRIGRLIIAINLLLYANFAHSQNLPPVLNSGIPNQHTEVGSSFSYTIPTSAFRDANNDKLTFSAINLPTGLSFNGKTLSGSFGSEDSHSVTIKATDPSGASSSETFLIIVHPTNGTYAAFSMNTQFGCGSQYIQFENKSNNATSFKWNFGNGNYSTLATPVANYSQPGSYTVTLTINDSLTYSDVVTIYENPQPNIDQNITGGCEPFNVTLRSTGDAGIYYHWYSENFPEQPDQFSTSETIELSNLQNGKYNVSLEVTDENGCKGLKYYTPLFEVYDKPTTSFTFTKENSCKPSLTTFYNTSTIVGSTIKDYIWKIDGNQEGTSKDLSYNFTSSGSYNVSLSEISEHGCVSDSYTSTVTFNENNSADFNFSPKEVCNGETVNFTSLASSGATSYSWNFGTTFSSDANPQNILLTTPGENPVQLTVNFNDGCAIDITKQVLIDQVTSDFNYLTSGVCKDNFTVNFSNTSFSATESPLTSTSWSMSVNGSNFQPFSTDFSPSLTGLSEGTYNIKLDVVDQNGCAASVTKSVFLTNSTIDFSTSGATYGCFGAGQTNFSAVFKSDYDNVSNYAWDFGDGNSQSGTEATASQIYLSKGNFDVSVTVTTTNGCTYSIEKTNAAQFADPPTIDSIKWDQGPHCLSSSVALSTYFSDGTDQLLYVTPEGTDTVDDVTGKSYSHFHQFKDIGSFGVDVIAIDNGCPSSTQTFSNIQINGPKASFSPSQTTFCSNPPYDATFNNSTSNNTGSTIEYSWDFGDLSTLDSEISPSHQYQTTGNFIVTLTATDPISKCSDSQEEEISLFSFENTPGIITATPATSGCAPLNVTFGQTISSYTSSNYAIDRYVWTFNDGTPDVETTEASVDHTYSSPGVYSVGLKVYGNGCDYSFTEYDLIHANGPIIDFGYSPATICSGSNVTFSSSTTKPTGDTGTPKDYLWDYGDGFTTTQQSPTTSYLKDTIYTVSLKVTDTNGCSSTVEKKDLINIQPFSSDFTIDNSLICNGTIVNFENKSSGYDITYSWDFNSDNLFDVVSTNLENENFTYNIPGDYKPLLLARANNGCEKQTIQNIHVVDASAEFSAIETNIGCAPAFAEFTHVAVDDDVISYLWNFGDGITSNESNPRHRYYTPGSYSISLTIVFKSGCEKTVAKSNYIIVDGAYGELNYDTTPTCAPNQVQFTISNMWSVDYVQWDFGNGEGSSYSVSGNPTTETISHTYNQAGYTRPSISLTSSKCAGSYAYEKTLSGEDNKVDIYTSLPPSAKIWMDRDTICQGVGLLFRDSSVVRDTVYPASAWKWTFASTQAVSDISTEQNPVYAYPTAGQFFPKLVVSNALGCTDSTTSTVLIRQQNNISSDFTASESLVCPNETINYKGSASVKTGYIVSYKYIFEGNDTIEGIDASYAFGEDMRGLSPAVTFVATDDALCSASTIRTVDINNLQAAFDYSPQPVYRGASVDFSDKTTSDFGTLVTSWDWNFENGSLSSSSDSIPQDIIYNTIQNGNEVTLAVTNNIGCTDTVTVNVDVLNNPPDLTSFEINVLKNSNYAFSAAEFEENYSDKDDHVMVNIKITELPTIGTLTYNGSPVYAGQTFIYNEISGLTYTSNTQGDGYLSWNAFDGTDYSSTEASLKITVLPEPPPPTLNDIVFNVKEDSTVTFGTALFSDKSYFYNSAFQSLSLKTLIIESLPDAGKATLTYNGTSVVAEQQFSEGQIESGTFTITPSAACQGSVSFYWNGFDSLKWGSTSAQVIVNYVNEPPTISNIIRENQPEDVAQSIAKQEFLNTYSDNDKYDNATMFYLNIPAGTPGSFRINNNLVNGIDSISFNLLNQITYTPPIGFNNSVEVNWGASDGQDITFATIRFSFINTPPAVNDIYLSGTEDNYVKLDKNKINEAFVDADPNDVLDSIRIETSPANGTMSYLTTPITIPYSNSQTFIGNIRYVPSSDWSGDDSFEYSAFDGKVWSTSTATIHISIAPVNDAPRPQPDTYDTKEDIQLSGVNVLDNDSDIDDLQSVLSVSVYDQGTAGENGTIALLPNGELTYTPNNDVNGTFSFIYQVCDDEDSCATTTVNINIAPVNDPPTAVNDSIVITETTSTYSSDATTNLLTNDFDVDGSPFTLVDANNGNIANVVSGKYGQIVIYADGNYTYTTFPDSVIKLDQNDIGEDIFSYTIADKPDSLTNTANLIVQIKGSNNQPIAVNDIIEINEETESVTANIINNDYDPEGKTVSVTDVTDNSGDVFGTISWNSDGNVTFNQNLTNTDYLKEGEILEIEYSYTITDGITSNFGIFTIRIIGINDAPIAKDDYLTYREDWISITINTDSTEWLLYNDNDVDDGKNLDVIEVNGTKETSVEGTVGILNWNPDGTYTYIPNADSIVQLQENETITDIFTYTISDPLRETSTAKLIITIIGKNDKPKPEDDVLKIWEDTLINSIPAPGLLANDSDPEHQKIIVEINGKTSDEIIGLYGTLYWDYTGAYSYKSDSIQVNQFPEGSTFEDIFTYRIKDPEGSFANAKLFVVITGQNDAPVARNNVENIEEKDTLIQSDTTKGLLYGDTDVDTGDIRTVSLVNESSNSITSGIFGQLDWHPDGTFTYTPNYGIDTLAQNETVVDSFRYVIEDLYDSISQAYLIINISGVNDNPTPTNDTITISEDTLRLAFNKPKDLLLHNDKDKDGDPIKMISLNNIPTTPFLSKYCSIDWDSTGAFTYIRNEDLDTIPLGTTVIDSIRYTIVDQYNFESSAYLFINIVGENDIPVAKKDENSMLETLEKLVSDSASNLLSNDSDIDIGVSLFVKFVKGSTGYIIFGTYGDLYWDANGSYSYKNKLEATDSLKQGEVVIDIFPYTLSDQHLATTNDSLWIKITGVNDAPVAVNDTISMKEDSTMVKRIAGVDGLLENDSDVDNDKKWITLINSSPDREFNSKYGTVTWADEGFFEFIPTDNAVDSLSAGEVVSEIFTYVLTDEFGSADTANIIITIEGENDNPVAVDDFIRIDEDTDSKSGTIENLTSLLSNDWDIDGDSLHLFKVNDSEQNIASHLYGELQWDSTGTYTFLTNHEEANKLAYGDTAYAEFPYLLSDSNNGTDTAQLQIEIIGLNDAPVAIPDSYTTIDKSLIVTTAADTNHIMANDYDVDGLIHTIISVNEAAKDTVVGKYGTLIWKNDGSFEYLPDSAYAVNLRPGEQITEEFSYSIKDEWDSTATSIIDITILGINNAPIAKNDTLIIWEDDIQKQGYLLPNDIDPDKDTLHVFSVKDSDVQVIKNAYGELFWNIDGTIVFYTNQDSTGIRRLGPNQSEIIRYPYIVSDGELPSLQKNIVLVLIGKNSPISAIDDYATCIEDKHIRVNVVENDKDLDNFDNGNFDYSSLTILSEPHNGEAFINSSNGVITYFPDENFNGKDSLKYQICDLGDPVYCDTAWFVIDVTPVNDPPVATPLVLETQVNTPVSFDALDQVKDVDDGIDSTSINLLESTNTVLSEYLITYTPDSAFIGKTEFTYSVKDSSGIPAYVIVTVIVKDSLSNYTAQNDSTSTDEDSSTMVFVLENDTIGGEYPNPRSVEIKVFPQNGISTYDWATQSISYQPDEDFNGLDSLTYIVSSGLGNWSSAKVYITVIPVNDSLVANDDVAITTTGKSVEIYIFNNDIDGDNGIDFTSAKFSTKVKYDDQRGIVTYTPSGNKGVETFTYSVCDNDFINTSCDSATVTVFINSEPFANNDNYETTENTLIHLQNPTPWENDTLVDLTNKAVIDSFRIASGPQHGTYSINESTHILTYIPFENYFGNDWIQYSICDSLGNYDVAEINIWVDEVNTPPVANDDSYMVAANEFKRFYILENDYDIDGTLDFSKLRITDSQKFGEVKIDATTGTIWYKPTVNSGDDSFKYEICDTEGACSSATVNITVELDTTVYIYRTIKEDSLTTIDLAGEMAKYNFNFTISDTTEVEAPELGTYTFSNNFKELTYTALPDSNGNDAFRIDVCSKDGQCAYLSFYIKIVPVNDPPVAINDTITWNYLTDTTIISFNDILKNDYDIDSDSIFLTQQVVAHGDSLHFAFNATDSTITITADTIFWCDAWFKYEIKDGENAVDTGTVFIIPDPKSYELITKDDSVSVFENSKENRIDILNNDIFLDDQRCTIDTVLIVTPPTRGTATATDDNYIDFVPTRHYFGFDSLQYQIIDLWGKTDSAWVYIEIIEKNTPPVAVADDTLSVFGSVINIPALKNDYDPDAIDLPGSPGDPNAFIDSALTKYTDPIYGTVVFDSTTFSFIYTPDTTSCDDDLFQYTIFDNEGDSATTTITISNEDAIISAITDTARTYPGVTVDVEPLLNDLGFFVHDIETLNDPAYGTYSKSQNTITYTPNDGFIGRDSMLYTIVSPCGNSTSAYILFLVEELRVPEIITPNEDGDNDVLKIDGIEYFPDNTLQIYNRYGHIVYQKKEYDNTWGGYSNKGSFLGNRPLPAGTYYYTLIYNEGRNRQAGFIYIFR
jgi:gliding motility-associated-like protein